MSTISLICGILLVLVGAAGYLYGVNAGNASFTALIPAAFGAVLVVLGAIGNARESLRMHLMHAAVVVGLAGFIIPFARLVSKLGDLTASAAVLSQAAMALICLIFVVLSIRSFIAARRARESSAE